jgi:enoyl-CoA hydratase/carnithine racemase
MKPFLLYQQNGPVVTLTMDQPEQRNPLTGNTAVPEFLAAVDRIQADASVRCVIVTGNGPSFCAGGDIREMQIRQDYQCGIQRLPLALFNLEMPLIAAINGHAIGAGLDLACMCDIRIASEKAKFAETFVKLGIIPGDGGAWLLPRVVRLSRAAMAKARTSEAAVLVANHAHALHGAIGVTEEYGLQLFTRRLHEWRMAHGSEAYWNQRIGEELLRARQPLAEFVRGA